jgi:hypothetical protein
MSVEPFDARVDVFALGATLLKFLLERLAQTTSSFICQPDARDHFSLLYNVQPQELHSVWGVVKQLVAWDKKDRPWAQDMYQVLRVK